MRKVVALVAHPIYGITTMAVAVTSHRRYGVVQDGSSPADPGQAIIIIAIGEGIKVWWVGCGLILSGIILYMMGRILRALPITPGPTIERLYATRNNYDWCNQFKNWHYNRFLEINSQYEENEARCWQIRQVYERGRWSTFFAGIFHEKSS